MCQEVFEMVRKMDMKDVELQIALQCAPLITGIKMSNLLIVSLAQESTVHMAFKGSGISYFRLWRTKDKVAFLLFRRNQMEHYLSNRQVLDILQEAGYKNTAFGSILKTFQERYQAYLLKKEPFPHEMGLLLGYPVEDVKGFILHRGENYLYSGYWKVYDRVEQKKRLFRRYEEAKETLIQLHANDIDIRLIVQIFKIEMPEKMAV